jgi:dihydroorotate dehydrogenase
MPQLTTQPIYDPARTFDDNFDHGPFGAFAEPQLYENSGEPRYTFLGFPVWLPFGIGAGPLPNAKYVAAALALGFDVNCYKTQRTVSFPVNDFPNILYIDIDGDLTAKRAAKSVVGSATPPQDLNTLTITNSFAMPSRGPGYWTGDLDHAILAEQDGQFVIMSVVGTIQPGFSAEDYYNDFAAAAKLAAGTGVKAIEVNLSCPNVASEGVLCYTPSAVDAITRKVKETIDDVPLVVKLGYFSADQQDLLEEVVEKLAPYTAAISAINTLAAPVVNDKGQQALPGKGRLSSGICGAAIQWAGLDMTHRLADLRKRRGYDYEIIGIGGVMNPDDFDAYRKAGADLVQSCTGAMWNPQLAQQIKRESKQSK